MVNERQSRKKKMKKKRKHISELKSRFDISWTRCTDDRNAGARDHQPDESALDHGGYHLIKHTRRDCR